jgi:hypothetical protein
VATAELNEEAATSRLLVALRRTWPCAYVAAWLWTLACALLVAAAGAAAQEWLRKVIGARLDPALNAPPALGHVLVLAVHNLPITAWPILLGVVGAHRSAGWRLTADVLVVAALIANTAPVGAALALYGPPLLAYLPQVPIEWAALALGTSAWLIRRRRPLARSEGIALFALTAAVVFCAALVETVAVPHRWSSDRAATTGLSFVPRTAGPSDKRTALATELRVCPGEPSGPAEALRMVRAGVRGRVWMFELKGHGGSGLTEQDAARLRLRLGCVQASQPTLSGSGSCSASGMRMRSAWRVAIQSATT